MNKELRNEWIRANFQWIKSQSVPNEGFKLTEAAQVASLPWAGNHYSDMLLFQMVDAFVLTCTDIEQQKLALYDMSLHGMGMEGEITDDDVAEYIKHIKS